MNERFNQLLDEFYPKPPQAVCALAVEVRVLRTDEQAVKQRACMAKLRGQRRARGLNNMGVKFGREHPEKVPIKHRKGRP